MSQMCVTTVMPWHGLLIDFDKPEKGNTLSFPPRLRRKLFFFAASLVRERFLAMRRRLALGKIEPPQDRSPRRVPGRGWNHSCGDGRETSGEQQDRRFCKEEKGSVEQRGKYAVARVCVLAQEFFYPVPFPQRENIWERGFIFEGLLQSRRRRLLNGPGMCMNGSA